MSSVSSLVRVKSNEVEVPNMGYDACWLAPLCGSRPAGSPLPPQRPVQLCSSACCSSLCDLLVSLSCPISESRFPHSCAMPSSLQGAVLPESCPSMPGSRSPGPCLQGIASVFEAVKCTLHETRKISKQLRQTLACPGFCEPVICLCQPFPALPPWWWDG